MTMAAMDAGDLVSADEHLKILQRKFPGSQRVRRLEGMRFEAGGSFEEAEKVYEQMLVENPSNSLARKRQVSVAGWWREVRRPKGIYQESLCWRRILLRPRCMIYFQS